jgi:chaperonin GroES
MNVQPLNGHVLLRPADTVERTAGGLYLPETARELPSEGIVEAVPPGGAAEVAVGDRVLYKKLAGEEISVDGRKHRLVPQGDLLAKFLEADPIPV